MPSSGNFTLKFETY